MLHLGSDPISSQPQPSTSPPGVRPRLPATSRAGARRRGADGPNACFAGGLHDELPTQLSNERIERAGVQWVRHHRRLERGAWAEYLGDVFHAVLSVVVVAVLQRSAQQPATAFEIG